MQTVASGTRKVHLISLGCARNRVDSEVMLGTLLGDGWEISEEPAGSDAVVVNTCGFIQSAKEESVDTILSAAELKKERPSMKLVVTGCLTQRYKSQLAKGLPEVDLFIGTDEFTKIAELLKNPAEETKVHARRTHYIYDETMPKVNTLTASSAYVKVAEGCQHNCAFCIIPAIRGKLRSRPIRSIVDEVEKLTEEGVLEVNLIAQDLAAFGRDRGQDELVPLLKELVKIEKLRWIRLLYVYPENVTYEFLEVFKNEDKIVKYVDIPMQHGSDSVLARMNRSVTSEQLRQSVIKLRAAVPEVAIRTSVMAGFPGETAEEFSELLDFVRDMKFDHLGCFIYSQEEGTVAGRMSEQVDEKTKVYRQTQVMELQKEISAEGLQKYVGTIQPVLVTGVSQESDLLMEGRLSIQAPEVDGVVFINDGPVVSHTIQNVRITESHEYDLVGHVLQPTE